MDNTAQDTMQELFGEPIYAYTRKQAIEDNQQVKLTQELADMARQAGWKYPVYLTFSVFSLILRAVENKKHCNDFPGVLWDILYMGAKTGKTINSYTRTFRVIITGVGRKKYYDMIIQVGPTDIDDPAPAITFMLPEEI